MTETLCEGHCDTLMPSQRPIGPTSPGGLLLSLLAVVACGKAPPPVPAAGQAPASSSRPSPTSPSSAVAQPDDTAWEGVLAEHLSHGMIYLNDANARDSTSAFEAALFTEATPPGSGPDRPDGVEAYWKPTVDQALKVGAGILAIAPASGDSAGSYRYVLMAVIEGGKRKILAQALCDTPDWWKVEVGRSKLCRSAGTCVDSIPPGLRGDCQLRFSYDVDTAKLERSRSSER